MRDASLNGERTRAMDIKRTLFRLQSQLTDALTRGLGRSGGGARSDPFERRRAAVLAAITEGPRDPAFVRHMQAADRARDRGAWSEAVREYADGLALQPLHALYLMQFGHCLKEMGLLVEAELSYRDAIALGAPAPDALEHLGFVAMRDGSLRDSYPSPLPERLAADTAAEHGIGRAAFELQLASSADARLLLKACLDAPMLSDHHVLMVLRKAPRVEDLMLTVIGSDAFAASNARLLAVAASGVPRVGPA
jgi:tetratricopeptide (TPR) repeat protein